MAEPVVVASNTPIIASNVSGLRNTGDSVAICGHRILTTVPGSANDDVTVVISCFNYGQWLPDAIASAREQDGGPPHVVVVDDGSTDDSTLAVLDRIEHQADVELIRQANRGAAAARNAGLTRARTSYLVTLDADDVLPRSALTQLKAALSRDRTAGFAYGRIEFFGAWSGVLHMPDYDPWRLLFRHIIGPTALMRRELIDATGGYDQSFPNFEDWELWVHALSYGFSGVKIGQTGLYQRKHGRSKLTDDRRKYRDTMNRLRAKHADLYDNLNKVHRRSDLGPMARAFYRFVWGARPWPASAESMLYSLLWRESTRPISTSTMTR
jgi:glycosyltransferase involved in cell wall biosynthesis